MAKDRTLVFESMANESMLLHALAVITRIATSLYGPGKARKQITGIKLQRLVGHCCEMPLYTTHSHCG